MSEDNPILGIIGTAGRGTDFKRLDKPVWYKVKRKVMQFIEDFGITKVASGGAAFADHLAVELYLTDKAPQVSSLDLYLPCKFDMDKCQFDQSEKDGRTSNFYHRQFSDKMGRNSLSYIREAIIKGASVTVGNGFFDRNIMVAKNVDIMLSLTFGEGEILKDSGTAHTTRHFISIKGNADAYHINLPEVILYKRAMVI